MPSINLIKTKTIQLYQSRIIQPKQTNSITDRTHIIMENIHQTRRFELQTEKQLLMFVGKDLNKDRKKKLSESKQGDRKTSVLSGKKPYPHNRSSSLHHEKKELRFNTDYGEYEQAHTANIGNYSKFQKKNVPTRRRETFDCDYSESLNKHLGVQSTKSNVYKNIELKGLFKLKEESKRYPQKQRPANHPLFKFLGKKTNLQKKESPYSKPIPTRHATQNSHSLSKQRQSLTKKHQIVLNKNNISLRNKDTKQHQLVDQQTQKVERQSQFNRKTSSSKGKTQEQVTVKAIKRQKQQKQDSLSSVGSNQSFGLTEDEESTFGDRFPYGFQKMKLLGRGGFSLVWLGRHAKSGREFAVKQIITQNTHQTHIKQIWFGTMFFTLGGVPKPQFSRFAGVKNLVRLFSYQINQKDTWIFYEKCGHSLGSALYDIRSEKMYGQQKLYKIHYKPLYQAMSVKPKLLNSLVLELCRALALLSECEVVHSDLKTENILIRFDKEGKDCELKEVKLIDYGSSFEFRNIAQFSMATPEYMPPEILNYIIHQNQGVYEEELYQQVMNDYRHPWAIDIWSLGCVILEIIVGVPLWMSLPLLIPGKQGSFLQKEGLFAVKGRLFPEIIAKQRSVNPHLDQILQKDNYSRIPVSATMKKIIKAMLDIDFNRRISPQQVIALLQKEQQ